MIVVDALEGRSRPSSHHLRRSSYTGASLTGIQVHGSLEMRAPAPTAAAFSFPPASSSVGRRTLRYRFMGRYREKTSTVKNIQTEIHSPKFTEIKSIYVAFQVGAHFQ